MIETILGNKTTFRLLRCMYLAPNRYYTAPELYTLVKAGHSPIDQCLKKNEFLQSFIDRGNNKKKIQIKF